MLIVRLSILRLVMTSYALGYDFQFFWAAGHLLSQGINPYKTQVFNQLMLDRFSVTLPHDYIFPYPPWAVLIFIPFGFLSYEVALPLWYLLMAMSLLGTVVLSKIHFIESEKSRTFWLLCVLLFPPVVVHFAWAQTALPVIFLLLLSWHWRRSRPLLSGIAFSLAGLKPQAVVSLLLYMVVRYMKAYSTALIGAMVMTAFQCLLLGVFFRDLIYEYFLHISDIAAAHQAWHSSSLADYLAYHLDMSTLPFVFQGISVLAGGLIGLLWDDERTGFLLSLLASMLFVSYTWTHTYVVLIPLWLLLCRFLIAKTGTFLFGLICIVQFLWAVFYLTAQDNYVELPMYYYLPIVSLPVFAEAYAHYSSNGKSLES